MPQPINLDAILQNKPRTASKNLGRELVTELSQISSSRSNSDSSIGESVLSIESLDSAKLSAVANAATNIRATISSIVERLGLTDVSDSAVAAATVAGMLATSPREILRSPLRTPAMEGLSDMATSMSNSLPGGSMDRHYSLEAYDERDNRNVQAFSIAYNLLATRQDDFCEAFYPTIVINPAQTAIVFSIRLYYVFDDFKRGNGTTIAPYARKNVVRAYADADILKNELTSAIPVYRKGGADDNTVIFVSETDVTPWKHSLVSNVEITTSDLIVDRKIDLIASSQTNELLASGVMGPSDQLDTCVRLNYLTARVTDGTNTDVFKIDVSNIPSATFTYSPLGNYKKMQLVLDTNGIVLSKETKKYNGGDLKVLTELENYSARIELSVNGSVYLDKGDCVVNRGNPKLHTLRDRSGALVTGAAYDALAAKIESIEIIGYNIEAYRSNTNLRQRGLLFDTQTEYRQISVPFRAPFAAIMPPLSSDGDDNGVIQTLASSVSMKICNDGVTALFKHCAYLAGYQSIADVNGELPETTAIGGILVKPVYFEQEIDLQKIVDNLRSTDKLADVRAAITEKIRFLCNEMVRISEYKAAAAVTTGNLSFKPTVIIGTDITLANYICKDGDPRTLGDNFEIKVVSSLDHRVKGHIFITFGVFDSSRNTSPNILNFGNMLYSPELTVAMPITRDGQISKEQIVTPRYSHVMTLPIMTVLKVTGLPEITDKIAINMHAVA